MSNPEPLRTVVARTVEAARNAQSTRILDALDSLVAPGFAWTAGIDAHGVAWVRHDVHGYFRGTTIRDALAQLLSATGMLCS